MCSAVCKIAVFGHWRFDSSPIHSFTSSNCYNITMNTKQQGSIGEAQALLFYSQKGYWPSVPWGDHRRYDLIIDKDGLLLRVQCKTSSVREYKGSWKVTLSTSGGNKSGNSIRRFNAKDCDLLFVVCADGSLWEIPSLDVDGKRSVNLSARNSDKYLLRDSLLTGFDKHLGEVKPKQVEIACSDCGAQISRKGKRCRKCAGVYAAKHKIDWPPIDDLINMVDSSGYSEVGRILGVSDVAVKKHIQTRISAL